MEKPELIQTEALYRIAGKSLADYLGYPSFSEYLRRTTYFYVNLTKDEVEERHLGELYARAADDTSGSFEALAKRMLEIVIPAEGEDVLRAFFDRGELLQIFASGESFASADGDCTTEGQFCRVQASCEMERRGEQIYGLFLINDISDLYDPHSLARKYAEYDPLTKLFSRHAADAYAKEYFNLHPDDPAALVLIEVDRFKDFNDRYGHNIGDLVLKGIARELEEHFGNDSIIGRNAGQEFLLLLKHTPAEEVEEAVKSFSEAPHRLDAEGESYDYTLSVGYSLYPSQGVLYHDLARKADKAKYNVRLGGGDSYCRFENEMLDLNNF